MMKVAKVTEGWKRTLPSSPYYLPASEQGPLEGAEDNDAYISHPGNFQARKSPRLASGRGLLS